MSPGLVSLAAVGVYISALVGYRMLRTAPSSLRDLDLAATGKRRSGLGALRSKIGGVTLPLVRRLTTDKGKQRLEHLLDSAGRPDRMTLTDVLKAKGADTVVCLVIGVVVSFVHPIIPPFVILYGWFRQDLQLRGKARARQRRIEYDLPDYLDILGVTIQAGLKFRGALRRVNERFESPVSEEFRIALQQMDVGSSRRAAFEGLRQRNESDSLHRFVGSLLQAEELGAPIGDAIVAISTDMRKAFAQRVKKDAAKAVPKVTLVATTFLVPAAALLLLGGMFLGGNIDLGGFGV